VTGTSKVPLEGFSQLQGSHGVQKFQIHKSYFLSSFERTVSVFTQPGDSGVDLDL